MPRGWWWEVQTTLIKSTASRMGCKLLAVGLSILPRNLDFKRVVQFSRPCLVPQSYAKVQRIPGTEPADWKFFNAADVTTMSLHRVPLNEFKARKLPDHNIGPTSDQCLCPTWLTGVYATFMRQIMAPPPGSLLAEEI